MFYKSFSPSFKTENQINLITDTLK